MSTKKFSRAHDDELRPAPPAKLPDHSWPAQNHRINAWDDYDLSAFPLAEEDLFREPQGLLKESAPKDRQRKPDSAGVYPGTAFTAPAAGFTGNHKKDYYASVAEYAEDNGSKGDDLLRMGGSADLNWKKRCYEINKANAERAVWEKYRNVLKKEPAPKKDSTPTPVKRVYTGIALHPEHQP